ncbi:GNAT family N-acetyltransferase [Kitasatospora brasiliensis]|uniref:GNAT family N-acetyltransferase n=1 Tax=Kitasatospora brasiliensis TaxID=3058040 RepID=UPI00292EF0AB|nr:GNAT family N-acetyltransferase [Kitasatospora sp. K002]
MTARLVLHPLTPALARGITAAADDGTGASGTPDANGPDGLWARGYPAPADIAGARRFLDVCAQGGSGPYGAYEIRRREDGLAIGGAGFHGPADDQGTVTVGYGLIPAARGHGYASEALRALLAHARRAGARRVLADTHLHNTASRRVLTAGGMRQWADDGHLAHYETTWHHAPAPGAP